MLPVRCYTCNKVLGNKGATFDMMKKTGVELKEIWEALGLTRQCCKTIMITHVDLTDELLKYENYNPCKYVEIRKTAPVDGSGKAKPRVYQAI
ncbi:MAG: RpoN/RPB10 RNA polymerase subunit family protein [Candidatus Hodarchaeales archaeon]